MKCSDINNPYSYQSFASCFISLLDLTLVCDALKVPPPTKQQRDGLTLFILIQVYLRRIFPIQMPYMRQHILAEHISL